VLIVALPSISSNPESRISVYPYRAIETRYD
jgi:hypothetical protein